MTMVILASMAPACLWLWYFHRLDHRPEPLGLVALVFLGGAAAVWPSIQVEQALMPLLPAIHAGQTFERLLFSTTLLAGVVEESAKLIVVVLLVCWRREFDEPVDGLVYAVAAAMGFTAAEDFLKHRIELEYGRMLSPPGHAMFAVFWGYELGMMLVQPRAWRLPLGWSLSVLAHGAWDAIAFERLGQEGNRWAPLVIFPLAMALFWWLESRLHKLQSREIMRRLFVRTD